MSANFEQCKGLLAEAFHNPIVCSGGALKSVLLGGIVTKAANCLFGVKSEGYIVSVRSAYSARNICSHLSKQFTGIWTGSKIFGLKKREFTLAFGGEVFRVFLILLGLLAIFEFLKYMGVRGYDRDLLKILEKVDFVIAVAAMTRGGWNFVGMLGAKKKLRGDRNAGN